MKDTIYIEGMMCTHCSGRVKEVLEAVRGVNEAIVSHETGTAQVTYESGVKREDLVAVIEKAGYQVKE